MKSDVMPGPATLPGADDGPARPAASGTGGVTGAGRGRYAPTHCATRP
ncbi:hypothetical protein QVL82_05220 [Cellulosimicrobium funkei]